MTSAPVERERDPFRATRSSPRVRWRLLPVVGEGRRSSTPPRAPSRPCSCSRSRACRARTRGRRRSPGTSSTRTCGTRAGTRSSGSAGTPRELAARPTPATSPRTPGRSSRSYPGARRRAHVARPAVERRIRRRSPSLAGLGAALVFHRLMSRFLEPDRALFAVVLFCVAPGVADHAVRVRRVARLPVARARAPAARRTPIRWLVPVIVGLVVHAARGARVRAHARAALGVAVVAARSASRSRCANGCSRHPSPCSRALAGSRGSGIAWAATGDLHGVHRHRARVALGVHRLPGARAVHRLVPGCGVVDWWLGQRGSARSPWSRSSWASRVDAVPPAVEPARRRHPAVVDRATRCTCSRCSSRSRAPSASSRRCSRCSARSPCRGRDGTGGGSSSLFLALQVGWLLICWGIDGRDWTPP